jgi:hypothetical protein
MAKFCPNCGNKISENVKFCEDCGADISFSMNQSDRSRKDHNEKDRKIQIAIAIFLAVITIFLVGIAAWVFIAPPIQQSIDKAQQDASIAATKDYNTLLPPSGADLKIVGSWSHHNPNTGEIIQQYNSDGSVTRYNPNTAYAYYGQTTFEDGTWGRLKGNNELVYRQTEQIIGGYILHYDLATDTLTCEFNKGYVVKMTRLSSSSTVSPTVQSTVQRTYVITVTTYQSGSDLFVIYQGGTDADDLTRLDATVVSSDGRSQRSFVDAPPIDYKFTFTGMATSHKDHVIITGTFVDGVQKTILDTYL